MSIYTLTFSADNPSKTALTDEHGRVVYNVETTFPGDKTLTHVRDADKRTLATLEWRDLRSDRVTRGEAKEIALGDWMKKSRIPFRSDVTFRDEQERGYKWKGCGSGEQLELFADDSSPTDPIAQFHRSRKSSQTPAKLILTTRAMEIRDTVVLSFLFLEKNRRMKDTSTQSKADVLGTPAPSIGNGYAINKGGVS